MRRAGLDPGLQRGSSAFLAIDPHVGTNRLAGDGNTDQLARSGAVRDALAPGCRCRAVRRQSSSCPASWASPVCPQPPSSLPQAPLRRLGPSGAGQPSADWLSPHPRGRGLGRDFVCGRGRKRRCSLWPCQRRRPPASPERAPRLALRPDEQTLPVHPPAHWRPAPQPTITQITRRFGRLAVRSSGDSAQVGIVLARRRAPDAVATCDAAEGSSGAGGRRGGYVLRRASGRAEISDAGSGWAALSSKYAGARRRPVAIIQVGVGLWLRIGSSPLRRPRPQATGCGPLHRAQPRALAGQQSRRPPVRAGRMPRTRRPGTKARAVGRRLANQPTHPQAGSRPGAAPPRVGLRARRAGFSSPLACEPTPGTPGDSQRSAQLQVEAVHPGQMAAGRAGGRLGRPGSPASWAVPVQPGPRRGDPSHSMNRRTRKQCRPDRRGRQGRARPRSQAAHRMPARSASIASPASCSADGSSREEGAGAEKKLAGGALAGVAGAKGPVGGLRIQSPATARLLSRAAAVKAGGASKAAVPSGPKPGWSDLVRGQPGSRPAAPRAHRRRRAPPRKAVVAHRRPRRAHRPTTLPPIPPAHRAKSPG